MIDNIKEFKHDAIIKSRKRLEMSGINDVSSFDDTEILVQTDGSGISIEGEGLKIERFDAENGELIVNGLINGIFYFVKDVTKKKKSITNLFK
ncbi:MAG: hypothetical protein J6A53_01535 [Clostridia bacterium]|nr:hypothetical protein [Clostridia bacterium]